MDLKFLYAGIALMLIIILQDFLKRKYGFDMNNFKIEEYLKKENHPNKKFVINKNTGAKNLVMIDAGTNKATVMATLRQITGIDYNSAKTVVETVPAEFMVNISEEEADLTKKALEFVGAKIKIK